MPSSSRPWGTWNLDAEFFRSLSHWTIDHPESSIDRILDGICTAVDNTKYLLGLIPDSPFPAHSLVQALGQLIKIGMVCFGLIAAI
jgi:hypothetical protein